MLVLLALLALLALLLSRVLLLLLKLTWLRFRQVQLAAWRVLMISVMMQPCSKP